MKELIIETADSNLYDDLRTVNIPGLAFSRRLSRDGSSDIVSTTIIAVTLTTIGIISASVTINLLSSWLYDRFKKINTQKTTINNIDITKNIKQINVILNDFLQEN
ncbi:MAG: hypothetical protein ABSF80_02025 [Chitinispirillaceae bacterium]|jgi:hypothetical protein